MTIEYRCDACGNVVMYCIYAVHDTLRLTKHLCQSCWDKIFDEGVTH